MTFRTQLARQLARPVGVLGALVGWVLARRNAPLNEWIVERLDVGPTHRVLEIGCGPGIGLTHLAQRAELAVGIDYSATMARRALRRNRRHVRAGRVQVMIGDIQSMSRQAEAFDRAMAVHVIYFWSDPTAALTEIRKWLRPEALLAVGFQAAEHMPDATRAGFTAESYHVYGVHQVTQFLSDSGFEDVQVERKGPIGAPEGFCALGRAPASP